jgi:hypothetical protein
MADTLTKYDESLISIYSKFMRNTPAEISAMMKEETWFNDAESVAIGLATGLEAATTVEPQIATWFRKTPAALLARTQQKNASAWRAKIQAIRHGNI